MARKYVMKRRAERQKETRRRIVDATVELHRTIGPLRTTISAIAEKAGVQRHTYYAHFPELRDLYTACTGHYAADHPPPDPSLWAEVADHEERLRRALSEVYAYYGRHEEIFANVLRDAEVDALCAEFTDPVFQNWERTWKYAVAEGWDKEGERGAAGRHRVRTRLPDVAHASTTAGLRRRSSGGVDGGDGAVPDAYLVTTFQLPRINLLGTSVNKDLKKGRGY